MKGNYFLFGLQRSGTNYLENLIRTNFVTKKLNRSHKSWKHSIDIPKGIKNEASTPTLIIHKNPYMWVESILYRNQVDWIKTQTKYDPLEEGKFMLGKSTPMNLSNIVKTYVHFHNTWIFNAYEHNTCIVKYEDLLGKETRENILSKIQHKFAWERNPDAKQIFRNPRPGSISQSSDYDSSRHQYYLDERPKRIEQEHIDEINSLIDDKFFEAMKYDRI